MTVVLAFDGDEAGQQAADNAVLTVLNLEDDQKDYLRSFVFQGNSFESSIKYLSNESLANEYRFWSSPPRKTPEWIRDEFKEYEEACMRLINYRSSLVSKTGGNDHIREFNSQNTITAVLASYGYNATPGRSVRCPSHDDTTPSLSVSRDDGRAYCFNQSCPLWHDGYGVDAYELNKILGA